MIWRDDKLIGHIAFANPMHKTLQNGCKVVFVLNAEDSYVTPNWCPNTAQQYQHVPTWNYQVVHMHGELYFKHSDKEKIAAVGLLTQLHERRLNGDNAWKMRDAPTDYIKTKLDEIVGIEFHINRLEAKSKLSQNREKSDYTAVMIKMGEMQLVGMNKRMKSLEERLEFFPQRRNFLKYNNNLDAKQRSDNFVFAECKKPMACNKLRATFLSALGNENQ